MIKIRKNYKKIIFRWGITVVGLAVAIYPIIIHPMMNPEKYQKVQKETRKNILQKNIQPGNMNVWRDPFDRKKDTTSKE